MSGLPHGRMKTQALGIWSMNLRLSILLGTVSVFQEKQSDLSFIDENGWKTHGVRKTWDKVKKES